MANSLQIGIYNAILLAGVIQGVFFGVFILTSKKYKAKSSFYLGWLLLSFAFANLQYSLEETEVISTDFLFKVIHIPWSVLVPPLLLFYGLAFLYPKRKIKSQLKLLFVPFALMLLVSTAYKILELLGPWEGGFSEIITAVPDFGDTYGDFATTVFLLVVITVLINKCFKYEIESKRNALKVIPIRTTWLKVLLFILLGLNIIWFFYTYLYAIDHNTILYPLYIATSIAIYCLGYIGIYKIGIFKERQKIRDFRNETKPYSIVEKSTKNSHILELQRIMEENKGYLDSSLSLEKISAEFHVSTGHLSRIINSEMSMGFSEYINRLRVEEAKTYLLNPEFENYTLVAIGLEAGFNSKSAFHASFKKYTSLTPLQFKKEEQNKS